MNKRSRSNRHSSPDPPSQTFLGKDDPESSNNKIQPAKILEISIVETILGDEEIGGSYAGPSYRSRFPSVNMGRYVEISLVSRIAAPNVCSVQEQFAA